MAADHVRANFVGPPIALEMWPRCMHAFSGAGAMTAPANNEGRFDLE
jgi:hypothetical protein